MVKQRVEEFNDRDNKFINWVLLFVALSLIISIFCAVFFVGMNTRDAYNDFELTSCKALDNLGYEVIMEKNLFLYRCLIIEDGEELTLDEHYEKHKFDGIKVK